MVYKFIHTLNKWLHSAELEEWLLKIEDAFVSWYPKFSA